MAQNINDQTIKEKANSYLELLKDIPLVVLNKEEEKEEKE